MLVVNMFAGPGAGKSSVAASLFGKLKLLSYHCEFVQEYAKELIWANRADILQHQWHVTSTQLYRIKCMENKVDIIVTDSPVLLGAVYTKDSGNKNPHLIPSIIWEHQQLNNLNFFIKRKKAYSTAGRLQTEEQAIEKDMQIKFLLSELNEPFIEIEGTDDGVSIALDIVKMAVQK